MKRIFSALLSVALAGSMLAITADESFAKSRKQVCKAYAKKQAYRAMDGDVGNGALAGATIGGLYGGVTGGGAGSNIITGIIAGGAAGALLNGAGNQNKRDRIYWRAYEDCMDNY